MYVVYVTRDIIHGPFPNREAAHAWGLEHLNCDFAAVELTLAPDARVAKQ